MEALKGWGVALSDQPPGPRRRRKLSKEEEAKIEEERQRLLAKIPAAPKKSENVRQVILEEVEGSFHCEDLRERDEEAEQEAEEPESEPEPEAPEAVPSEDGKDEGEPKLIRRKHRRLKIRDMEAGWGKFRGTLWWVLAGFASLACIALLSKSDFRAVPDQEPLAPAPRPAPLATVDESPYGDLVVKSPEMLPVVQELASRSQEPGGDGVATLYRGGEATLRKMEGWWERAGRLAPLDLAANPLLHISNTAGTPSLRLEGRRTDHAHGAMFFVKEFDRYVIDWEATVGYSEVLPKEVEVLSDGESRMMRAVLAEAMFYQIGGYKEEDFVCVTLYHRDRGEFLWGYAAIGSLAEREITRYLAEKPEEIREHAVTLRIGKGLSSGNPNQVEIVGFEHWGWVTPQEEDGGS